MKKKKGLQKVISAGLTVAMAVGLCACGNMDDGRGVSSSDPSLAKQYVYSYEEISLPDMGDNYSIDAVKRKDDRIIMLADIYYWNDYGSENEIKLLSMAEDGSDMQTITVELPSQNGGADGDTEEDTQEGEDAAEPEDSGHDTYEYTSFSNYTITNNDVLYGIKNYYFEDYSDPDNYVSRRENSICAWDLDGKLMWEKPMDSLETEEEYHYVRAMIPAEDGSVILLIGGDSTYMMTMDTDGNLAQGQNLPNGNDILQQASDFMVKDDGTILLTYYGDDWNAMYLTTYDVETDTVGEATKLPDTFMWTGYNSITTGVSTDIVYSTSSGVYGYSAGDEQPVQIMSYINSDLDSGSLNNIMVLDDTHFIGFYYDNSDGNQKGAFFTKRNPEDIPDKEVIVIAGNYVSYDLKSRAVQFNKENEQYRIVVKEYDSYNTMEDYTAGYTQLNNDIISGNMPDILLASTTLPIENYISKGLIANVDELIAQDEELSQVEFVDNVFESYRINDKLYYVIPSFYVRTMLGKTAILGDRDSWTMQEFQDLLATLPEGTQGIGDLNRYYFTSLMMQYCGNDFVDVATGKCAFDSQNFISMLEYAKTLPEEINYEDYGDDYWMNYQSQYREDRTVLMETYIGSVSDMMTTMNGYFGEDVTFIGFPTESGSGSILGAYDSYVLSAKSKNLDGAWQFIRYYLTDEYQQTLSWGMPVNKSIFMEKAQEALQKPYYLDEDGNKVEYDNYFEINGESVTIDPLSQEQIDQVVDTILSVDKCSYNNESIMNIINEEADAFYAGQKSASDVAQIIQSRAQIYVDENR